MVRYLQWKNGKSLETIDQLDRAAFQSGKDFRNEQRRLSGEYRIAYGYGDFYWSQRSCKDWNK